MNNEIETRFRRDYGLKYPIALAPMAFIGTAPDLAIAMCTAGGVGSPAVGPLPAAAVCGLIKAVKAATDGRVGTESCRCGPLQFSPRLQHLPPRVQNYSQGGRIKALTAR